MAIANLKVLLHRIKTKFVNSKTKKLLTVCLILHKVKTKNPLKSNFERVFVIFRDRVGIQTPNLLIRSETLYSVELHSHILLQFKPQTFLSVAGVAL